MSDHATKDDIVRIDDKIDTLSLNVDKLGLKVDKAVEDLSEIISNIAQSMHDEIVGLKTENKEIKESINKLTNTIDGFIARINHYETEQAARDYQFQKLLAWARKVSEKTGIPLENL